MNFWANVAVNPIIKLMSGTVKLFPPFPLFPLVPLLRHDL
jgi:hypothetical protein